MLHIRHLAIDDIPAADPVIMSAYHCPSRQVELKGWMELEATTWLGGEEAGQMVGMVGAIDYGAFAYIGFMGVHADFQRRGYGRALMLALIESLERSGQPCTLLDASPAGAPLYAQIGYVDLSLALVYRQSAAKDFEAPPMQVEPVAVGQLSELADFDRAYFGADRTRVLRLHLNALPGRAFCARGEQGQLLGYTIAQAKRLGPWVAASKLAAAALLKTASSLAFSEPLEVLLPSPNPLGSELLQSSGFELQRTLRHMGRGTTGSSRHLTHIYGQSSFMLG